MLCRYEPSLFVNYHQYIFKTFFVECYGFDPITATGLGCRPAQLIQSNKTVHESNLYLIQPLIFKEGF